MQVFFTGINQNGSTGAIVDMLRKKTPKRDTQSRLGVFFEMLLFSSVRTDVQWGHLTA